MSGGRDDDCIDGGTGGDNLFGSIGKDRIYGLSGNDHLNGGPGSDRLSGGSGNDTINAAFGQDRIFGGSGRDDINVATAGKPAKVSCGSGPDKSGSTATSGAACGAANDVRAARLRIRTG